jgi:hypothetical protein
MPLILEEDLEWARNYIEDCRWKTSKMSAVHAYTVREWRPDNDADFVRMVELIRAFGHPENFYSKTYIYLHIDGLKYWTMGDTMDGTIIINRAPSTNYYGKQKAPVTNRTYPETIYDRLAPKYDKRYSEQHYILENKILFKNLKPHATGSILDIGCGTGLLLDYMRPVLYLGLDPSQGMMNEFIRKYPHYGFAQTRYEDFDQKVTFDLAVSLFGSPSYIEPKEYKRMANAGTKYFYMFYREDYLPDYYKENPTSTDYDEISRQFETITFTNYLIATNIEPLLCKGWANGE